MFVSLFSCLLHIIPSRLFSHFYSASNVSGGNVGRFRLITTLPWNGSVARRVNAMNKTSRSERNSLSMRSRSHCADGDCGRKLSINWRFRRVLMMRRIAIWASTLLTRRSDHKVGRQFLGAVIVVDIVYLFEGNFLSMMTMRACCCYCCCCCHCCRRSFWPLL